MRYILYARKSSESEDRQMTSNEDQVIEMKRIASELKLHIIDVICESKSAKRPGRIEFNRMLARIQKGEADGILCWKLNRLARNPVDGGQISWLLQQGIIKHIQTYGRSFTPDDNVLMMQVEFGMANQFIKDLKGDVERGMKRKIERQWYPTKPPVGYKAVNRKIRQPNEDEVVPDPVQFPILRRLWVLALSGSYSITALKKEGDRLGLCKRNGTCYSLTTYYKIFSNEFYTGCFYWTPFNGIRTKYEGKHKPMVTWVEFQKVQDLLHNRGDVRKRKNEFPYRGIIKCGECQGSVTAEQKLQAICTNCKLKFSIITVQQCPRCKTLLSHMSNPTILNIVYYRCTKKKKRTCTQGYITKTEVEQTILQELQSISISKEFVSWALLNLRNSSNPALEGKETGLLKKRKAELQNRLTGLITMRADGELNKEQFETIRIGAIDEISAIDTKLQSHTQIESLLNSQLEEKIDFLLNGIALFKNRDPENNTKLLSGFGSNPILKDKKLIIPTEKVLKRLKECDVEYVTKIMPVEPKINLLTKRQKSKYHSAIKLLCSKLNTIRTLLKGIIKRKVEEK